MRSSATEGGVGEQAGQVAGRHVRPGGVVGGVLDVEGVGAVGDRPDVGHEHGLTEPEQVDGGALGGGGDDVGREGRKRPPRPC